MGDVIDEFSRQLEASFYSSLPDLMIEKLSEKKISIQFVERIDILKLKTKNFVKGSFGLTFDTSRSTEEIDFEILRMIDSIILRTIQHSEERGLDHIIFSYLTTTHRMETLPSSFRLIRFAYWVDDATHFVERRAAKYFEERAKHDISTSVFGLSKKPLLDVMEQYQFIEPQRMCNILKEVSSERKQLKKILERDEKYGKNEKRRRTDERLT